MGHPQPVAVGTHAERTVKTKQLRRRWLVAHPAFGAGIIRTVEPVDRCILLFFRMRGRSCNSANQFPIGQFESLLHRFGQSRTMGGARNQSIDNNFNRMFVMSSKSQFIAE